jgi:DHA2 family multidrug resistance protein
MIMFLAMGFGLYGGVFIFPLFVQNILNFTPTATGLVMMPGAIATGAAALLSGRLLNGKKQMVNPRYIIIFGIALFVLSMWDLGHLTIFSGEPDTRWALIIRGFGLGCLFAPINVAAFSTLRGTEIAQGASLLNLCRQLGGSFGIAYLGTHISNQTATHLNALSAHLTVGNPAFDQRLQVLQQSLAMRGYDLEHARLAALAIIERTAQMQAMVMSYNDAFLFIGLTVVLVSPCVFLLRSSKAVNAALAAEMSH